MIIVLEQDDLIFEIYSEKLYDGGAGQFGVIHF